jgi:hypothetical protein
MPPQKTPPEAGSTGEPDETFLNLLLRILLEPRAGENPELHDRARLSDILTLNSGYLGRSGADANHEARDKLALIRIALWDLSFGVTHPIFRAKKLEHGAPDSSAIWRSRTALAIALDHLIAAGVHSRIASKKISKTPGIDRLLGKGAKAETSLINWRARLREGLVPNELARELWDWSRKVLDGLTGSPSEKRKFLKGEADRLIAAAVKDIGQI